MPKNAFKKPWESCVSSDRVSTMLRAEYWERFREARKAAPFRYIRCHGLLCDDMGVLRIDEVDGEKRVFHNFSYIDQVFDLMLANGARPFIELGFMPEALASGKGTVFWWKGNITPPSDWSIWSNLVTGLFTHLIARYGAEEVRSWPVEVWNEPNLTVFWENADQEKYFRLYETTALAVKAVDPAIRVGGPAICGGADHWIDEFLAFVKAKGLPLDFFTRHLYTGQPGKRQTPEFFYQALSTPQTPIDELRSVRERIDRAGFPGLEIHITEFNTSYNPLCPVHDTPLNAAYLARLLSQAGDFVETLSFWTFSDIFEELDIPRSLFHGGFGFIARHGIRKPTYHLFSFFSRLGGTVLHRDDHCVATLANDGSIALVAWNPVQEQAERVPERITLDLPWTRGKALARRSRVHEEAGNPWGLWRKMGRPRYPDKRAIEFLMDSARPDVSVESLEPVSGTLHIELELRRNELTLVELLPFVDESPSYIGLDDSLIDGY